ncbi:hypothetical protein, partial [Fulvivirga kasyanovii]
TFNDFLTLFTEWNLGERISDLEESRKEIEDGYVITYLDSTHSDFIKEVQENPDEMWPRTYLAYSKFSLSDTVQLLGYEIDSSMPQYFVFIIVSEDGNHLDNLTMKSLGFIASDYDLLLAADTTLVVEDSASGAQNKYKIRNNR